MGMFLASGIEAATANHINNENVDLARENRQWAEDMSNSAHQREIADLKAAGLNPTLSATGGSGSSTPTSSPAQKQAPNIMGAINTAADTKVKKGQQSLQAAQQENINQDTKVKQQTEALTANTARKAKAEADLEEMKKGVLSKGWSYVKGLADELPSYGTAKHAVGDAIEKTGKAVNSAGKNRRRNEVISWPRFGDPDYKEKALAINYIRQNKYPVGESKGTLKYYTEYSRKMGDLQ